MKEHACPCVVLCAMLRKGTNITTFNGKKKKKKNLNGKI